MRLALAFLLAALSLACAGRPSGPRGRPGAPEGSEETVFKTLHPGTYECRVAGMLCMACAQAIIKAVGEVEGLERAEVDFDQVLLRFTVAAGRAVPTSAVERALKRAESRVDLGTKFKLVKVRYVP